MSSDLDPSFEKASGELIGFEILGCLPEQVRSLVVSLLEPRSYSFGELITVEGDPSDCLFLLVEGSVRALKVDAGSEISLGRFGPGDLFGETGILERVPRTATVRASSAVRVLALDARVTTALMEEYPEFRAALEGKRRSHMLNRFVRTQSVFSTLSHEGTSRLVSAMERVEVAQGAIVFAEGDPSDGLFLIHDGKLEVHSMENGQPIVLRYLRTGDMFGESALEPGKMRTAGVTALQPSILLKISADQLHGLAREYPDLAERIDQLVSSRKRLATVPLDFSEELLPVDADNVAAPPSSGVSDPGLADAPNMGDAPPSAPAVTTVAPNTKWRRRKRFPFIRQLDEMDCGAACLGMVARYYGRDVSLTYLRQESGVSVNGTTLRGLQRGGEAIGIETKAFRVSPENLRDVTLPAIVHWEANHWVVLYELNATLARIGDPAQGIRRLTRAEFDAAWTGYVAVMLPTPALKEAPLSSSGLSWVLPFLRPHKATLVLAMFLALGAALAEVAIPIVSQKITDVGIAHDNKGLISVLGGVLLLLAASNAFLLYRQRLALTNATVSIDVAALTTLTQTLLRVPMSYLETRKTGDIERRLISMQQVTNALTTQGISSISAVVQLALIIVVMVIYSPILAGIFLAMVALYMVVIRYAFVRIRPVYAALEHAYGLFSGKQVDLFKGMQSVKLVGRRPGIRAQVAVSLETLSDKRRLAAIAGGRLNAAITGIGLGVTAVFVFLGAIWVVDRRFTLGQFVAFNLLVALALVPAQLLASIWDDVQKSSVLLHRLQDVFEQEPEQADRSGTLLPVRTLGGRVELQGVTFAFDTDAAGHVRDERSYVLRGCDLEVSPGMVIGVVGRSGSGKSTLLKLLAGLVEPTSGRVLFDGIDMTTLDYGALRQRLGFVEQAPHLFNSSIAENIALGDPNPDIAQIRRVAEIADAHDFISRLPLGYATPVGDGGLRLSGGQSQRISIARALYWDPAIILLDEATSALDSESERRVKLSLDSALEGRTAFIVAHRLSTVRDADSLIVLDDGRIVEQGNHEQLMQLDGLYAYLYAMQARLG